ncbi:FliM/FliN family flagellar motor switch protein [Thermaurantiacus sp.]
MTDLSHGKLSGEPLESPADEQRKARGKPRKPGLSIDFSSEGEPLHDPAEPPADGGETPFARQGSGAGGLHEGPGAGASATVQEADSAPGDCPPGAARRGRQADAMAALRAAGVPPALARIDVTVTVEVGRRRMALAEILASRSGEVIALDRLTDEPVDVLVNGKLFARGEIVAVGDSFGVRLVALAGSEEQP